MFTFVFNFVPLECCYYTIH